MAKPSQTLSCRLIVSLVVLLSALGVSFPLHALDLNDIVNMSRLKISDDVIISTIKQSKTRFDLSPAELEKLKREGVSEAVLRAMQGNGSSPPAVSPKPAATKAGEGASPSASGGSGTSPSGAGASPRRAPVETRPSPRPPPVSGPVPPPILQIKRQYELHKYVSAASGAYDLLSGPDASKYVLWRTSIQYYLGKSLFKLGEYPSAHSLFLTVAAQGPDGIHYKGALTLLTQTSKALHDYEAFAEVLKGAPPHTLPRRVRSTLYYLMGLNYYNEGKFEAAMTVLADVAPDSEWFARARFLDGASKYRQAVYLETKSKEKAREARSKRLKEGDDAAAPLEQEAQALREASERTFKDALRSFYDLIRTPELVGDDQEIKDILDLALLNMARIYYRGQNFENAERLYNQMPRDSSYWPQAIYEAAYANFWQDDYPITLGHLLTLSAPQIRERYFLPEAEILRALVYFSTCHFDRVLDIIDHFDAVMAPLNKQLDDAVEPYRVALSVDESRLFDHPDAMEAAIEAYRRYLQDDGTLALSSLPKSVQNAMGKDRSISNAALHARIIEERLQEMRSPESRWAGTALGRALEGELELDLTQARAMAGRRFLADIQRLKKDYSALMSNARRIRIEVNNAETEALLADERPTRRQTGPSARISHSYATESRYIYWPFRGEFWDDELGFYLFPVDDFCAAAGEGVSRGKERP